MSPSTAPKGEDMATVPEPASPTSEKPHSQDPVKDDTGDPARAPSAEEEDGENYPQGVTVVLIMFSLILAVLTVALVCHPRVLSEYYLQFNFIDHCRTDPFSQPPSRTSQTILNLSRISAGMAAPTCSLAALFSWSLERSTRSIRRNPFS